MMACAPSPAARFEYVSPGANEAEHRVEHRAAVFAVPLQRTTLSLIPRWIKLHKARSRFRSYGNTFLATVRCPIRPPRPLSAAEQMLRKNFGRRSISFQVSGLPLESGRCTHPDDLRPVLRRGVAGTVEPSDTTACPRAPSASDIPRAPAGSSHTGSPSAPPRCTTEVSTQISRSSCSIIAAVSPKSRSSGPRSRKFALSAPGVGPCGSFPALQPDEANTGDPQKRRKATRLGIDRLASLAVRRGSPPTQRRHSGAGDSPRRDRQCTRNSGLTPYVRNLRRNRCQRCREDPREAHPIETQ